MYELCDHVLYELCDCVLSEFHIGTKMIRIIFFLRFYNV